MKYINPKINADNLNDYLNISKSLEMVIVEYMLLYII